RGVEHGHAPLRKGRHRDVVRPRPGASDGLHAVRNLSLVQVRRTDQYRVRLREIIADGVVRLRKTVKPGSRDVVEYQYPECSLHESSSRAALQARFASNSFM